MYKLCRLISKTIILLVTLFGLFGILPTPLWAGEWSGYVAGEFRRFLHTPTDARQHGDNAAISFQPEFYHDWDNNNQSITFVPFMRIDEHDEQRTHFDIRELTWIKAAENWELHLGIGKVFWGVTESQHLVDIINQTDLVESPDGEDKLGQPMINLVFIRDWGTVDALLLPYFRERSFPGAEGRLRSQPHVDTDQAVYESSAEQKHLDYALRWSHTLDEWDMGFSHFHGTSRDPRLVPGTDSNGNNVLVPHYDIISQTGLDVQATIESWLWKLEAIRRTGQGAGYYAATAGFEYTFYGLFTSTADLGLLLEYLYDDRGQQSTSPFQDDVFIGLRLTLNDVQDTQILIGIVEDNESDSRIFSLEASRRLGNSFKLNAEAHYYEITNTSDPLYAFRNDDFLQLELAYYF